MRFAHAEHRGRMKEAMKAAKAVSPSGWLDREYAAALFILTGMEWTWPRLKPYTGERYIDCEGMLNDLHLSKGEELLVSLAGNLFNGRTYSSFQPIDLIDVLDDEMLQLAITGFAIRRSDTNLAAFE